MTYKSTDVTRCAKKVMGQGHESQKHFRRGSLHSCECWLLLVCAAQNVDIYVTCDTSLLGQIVYPSLSFESACSNFLFCRFGCKVIGLAFVTERFPRWSHYSSFLHVRSGTITLQNYKFLIRWIVLKLVYCVV